MRTQKLTTAQKNNRRRIIEVSFLAKFSHLGSCLSAVDLIEGVYQVKKEQEKFILSNGHAAVAWYVILEKFGFITNPKFFQKLSVHPTRNPKIGIHVSTGSLGHGLPIAVGMALARKTDNIYCMISDGECAEGSIWECLRIISDQKIHNLKIIINANGWGAYDSIELKPLINRLKAFGFEVININGHDSNQVITALKRKVSSQPIIIFAKTKVEHLPFLKGQDAHYYVMNDQDYNQALEILR